MLTVVFIWLIKVCSDFSLLFFMVNPTIQLYSAVSHKQNKHGYKLRITSTNYDICRYHNTHRCEANLFSNPYLMKKKTQSLNTDYVSIPTHPLIFSFTGAEWNNLWSFCKNNIIHKIHLIYECSFSAVYRGSFFRATFSDLLQGEIRRKRVLRGGQDILRIF